MTLRPATPTEPGGPHPPRRPRVVVVAQARPALGGIPTFAELIVDDPRIGEVADVTLLNTTRRAVREAGTLSSENVRNAVQDTWRVFRSGRGADVVHLHVAPGRLFPLARTLALCAAAKAAGAGVLCHVHSARINGAGPDGFDPGPLFRLLLRRLAHVDAVLTVSESGTRTLRRLVPAARVETVDNAVDVEAFSAAVPDRSPVVLLFVGTLSVRKGLLDLFEALGQLASPPGSWELVVVGGAAEVGEREAEQIRQAARDAGLATSLVGQRRGEELRTTFASASALVLPSHWEGQPMVILEAMASGLPVVTTRIGAIPDVVRDDVEGLLLEARDVPALTAALDRLVSSPADRARWGAAARARALEHHDVPVLARRLAGLYHEVARRPAPARRARGRWARPAAQLLPAWLVRRP